MRDRDKKAAFKGTTYISAILDRSGSMSVVIDESRNAYNNWLKETKQASVGQDVDFTCLLFDDRQLYTHRGVQIRLAKQLTRTNYYPRGMTALNDALGSEILRLKDTVGKKDRCLILVMTDGLENASQEINSQRLKRLIEGSEERPNWTIQYIGANQDAFAVGRTMGMRSSPRITRHQDAHGTQSAGMTLSANTTEYLSSNSLKANGLRQADYDLMYARMQDADPETIQRLQKAAARARKG